MSDPLTFSDYQDHASETARYANRGDNIVYPVLGLNGEAGELAEKIKKRIREDQPITEDDRRELTKELGDVLWYLSAMADELDVPLEDVAKINLDKLSDREDRGVLYGDGDNR